MAIETIRDLTAGTAIQNIDLFVTRQGADIVDTKITAQDIREMIEGLLNKVNLASPASLGKTYAAFGDNTSRTPESVYGSLAAAQADYPDAISGEEFDGTVIKYAIKNNLYGFLPSGTYLISAVGTFTSPSGYLVGEEGTQIKVSGSNIDGSLFTLTTGSATFRKIEFDMNHKVALCFTLSNSSNYDYNTFKDCKFYRAGLVDQVASVISGFISFGGTRNVGRIENCYFEEIVVTSAGSHVVLNNDFSSDTIWTKGTGWTIAAGVASCDGTQTANSDLTQGIGSLREGETGTLTFTVSNYSAGTITPVLGGTSGTARSANGTYVEDIVIGADKYLIFRADADFVGDIDTVSIDGNVVYGTYGAASGGGRHIGVSPTGTGHIDIVVKNCTFRDDDSEARELDILNLNVNAKVGPGLIIDGCDIYYGTMTRRPIKDHEWLIYVRNTNIYKSPNFVAAPPVNGDPQSDIGVRCNGAIEVAGSAGFIGSIIADNCYIDYSGLQAGSFISGTTTDSSLVVRNSVFKGSSIKYSRYSYEFSTNQVGFAIGFRDSTAALYAHCINNTFLKGTIPTQLVGSNGIVDGCTMNDPSIYGLWINATVHSGTAQAGSTSTTLNLSAGASNVTNFYRAKQVRLTGGTGAGQLRTIVSSSSSKIATVYPAWTTTPDATTTYQVGGGNMRVSNNEVISRTPTYLTTNTEIFPIQGNTATEVNVYGNTFTRAGNDSSITRFIRVNSNVFGKIHDNTCRDTSISCVNFSDSNTYAKIYNNNDQPHVRANTATTYTVTQTDHYNHRTLSNASAITCTLPNDLPAGFETTIEQLGVGQVSFTAASGATLTLPTLQSKTNGQYAIVKARVVTNTTGTNASWVLTGDLTENIRVVTAAGAVTLAQNDFIVEVNKATGAATTVNLPSTPIVGKIYAIKDGKGDAGTNNITLTPAAGNIDGAATYVMNTNYQATKIYYSGSEWRVV